MKIQVLLGRILFGIIFAASAPGHFQAHTIQMAAGHGLPFASFLVPASGVIAALGGLSVILGYKTRLGAWLLIVFLVPVTVVMHNFWTIHDPTIQMEEQIQFIKNISLIGAALMLTYFGAGPLSLDEKICIKKGHFSDSGTVPIHVPPPA